VLTIINPVLYNLVNGNMTPLAGWITLVVLVGLFAVFSISRAARRRSRGLSAPPLSITVMTIVVAAVAVPRSWRSATSTGGCWTLRCRACRGSCRLSLPSSWRVLAARQDPPGSLHLRDRRQSGSGPPGRHQCAWIRTFAFTLVGLTAGFAGLVYESRLGSISVGFDGGTYVLYAVAAAVIGGTSLMGGRARPSSSYRLGSCSRSWQRTGPPQHHHGSQDMATALVCDRVTIDSVVRRRGVVGG